jgi:hypothetical protein
MLEKYIHQKVIRDLLSEIVDAIPIISGIFDPERRLLYANKAMQNAINLPNFEDALYLKAGELFQCVNAALEPGGCGASEACELCGAFNALTESKKSKKSVSNEFRILVENKQGIRAFTYRFTSSPLDIEGQLLFLINIEDISSEKRRKELEKVFYHDMLNSAGSLFGVIHILKKKQEFNPHYLDILESTYNTLYDTIVEQRQISYAESGELSVKSDEIHSHDLIIENMLPFQNMKHYKSELLMDDNAVDLIFKSDQVLLSRVLTNMIKNALEAETKKGKVRVGAERGKKGVKFFVHNPEYIEKSTQLQIFNRSFSTKGAGRGLGTFSIKLLGEEYLKGKTGFNSDKKEGTTFWIEIPLEI